MNLKNQNFQNSLRCLQHPLSLASIALLLFNDHVLKIVSPSWLTGKLSDFAGLFFFPFIISATLSLLFARVSFASQLIGRCAFGIAALWFILLKTSPLINSLNARLFSMILGSPIHFILDRTDVIGLMAMIPAWRLWNQDQHRRPTKLAYIALSVSVLAAIATSPREPTIDIIGNKDSGHNFNGCAL